MFIYIPADLAREIHQRTITYSGGGNYDELNIGYLFSVLDLIQNDDYYPSFGHKLTHLVWSINKNHAYSDGNKRLSITLGAQFLLLNGYMFCVPRFMLEMENISYHLAAGRINKELLFDLINSFLNGDDDFNEELKLRLLLACENDLASDNE